MLRRSLARIATRKGKGRSLATTRTAASHHRPDSGMTTAEYAVGTLAACAFATVLYKVVTSSWAADMLEDLIRSALNVAS